MPNTKKIAESFDTPGYYNVCFTICRVFFGAFFNSAFGFVDSRRLAIPTTEGNKFGMNHFQIS